VEAGLQVAFGPFCQAFFSEFRARTKGAAFMAKLGNSVKPLHKMCRMDPFRGMKGCTDLAEEAIHLLLRRWLDHGIER
jgi:hypothetical protein